MSILVLSIFICGLSYYIYLGVNNRVLCDLVRHPIKTLCKCQVCDPSRMIVQRRTVNYASITPLVRCDSPLQWLALSLHFCNLTGIISTLYSLMQYSSYQTLPKPSTTQYFFWRGQNSEICFTKHVQTDKNGLYNLLAYMSHDAFKRNHTSTPYWPKSKFSWPNTMIWITNYYKPCEVKKCTSDKSFDKRIYRKPCKSCALCNIVLFFSIKHPLVYDSSLQSRVCSSPGSINSS